MSSGFVTEKEAEEKRRIRQEEWEKVRKPEDPKEAPLAPEQLPDRRSLYERLQEQKTRKQEEFEESHKLKNLVKGLDDDEADFLDHIDKTRLEAERKKRLEEAQELSDFRTKVAELREKDLDNHIKQEIGLVKKDKKPGFVDDLPSIGVTKTSQSKLLAGLVKRKSGNDISTSDVPSEKKSKDSDSNNPAPPTSSVHPPATETDIVIPSVPYKGNLVCIGVLPGLDSYTNSSSEESDSTSDSERSSPLRDLCGRQISVVDSASIDHDDDRKSGSKKEKKK